MSHSIDQTNLIIREFREIRSDINKTNDRLLRLENLIQSFIHQYHDNRVVLDSFAMKKYTYEECEFPANASPDECGIFLSTRAQNILQNMGAYSIGAMSIITTKDLKKMRNCGISTISEIMDEVSKIKEVTP